MKSKLIGMRTLKTALVVVLAYFVSSLIPNSLPFALIVAAILCVETSVASSFEIGFNRVLGTILGGVVALILSYLPIYTGFSMALGVILVILMANALDIKKSSNIAMTIVVIILIGSDEFSPAVYAFTRTLDTLIGIAIATLVNTFFFPPNQMMHVRSTFADFRTKAKNAAADVIHFGDTDGLAALGTTLDQLRTRLGNLDHEISPLRKYQKEELEYYHQMLEQAEKVYIHVETLALSEGHYRITRDNRLKVSQVLSGDLLGEEEITLEECTRDELIYNYTMAKLLSAMEKILREKTFKDEH